MPELDDTAATTPRWPAVLGGVTALVGASILALAVLFLLWSPRLHVPPSGRGGLLDIFGIVSVLGAHGVLLATHRPSRDPGHVALITVVGATLVILATLLIVGL